jgi:hypothetical protein
MSIYLLILITIFVVANVVSALAITANAVVWLKRYEKDEIGWQMYKSNVLAQEQSWQISNAISIEDRIALEKLVIENKILREQRDNKYLNEGEE